MLTRLLDEYEVLSLNVITSGERPCTPLTERVGDDVHYHEWSLSNELDLLASTDVGIRPLTDDVWTRGKGGFTSVVQCLGLGLPVTVTPVGMVSSIVEHGETGYLATTDEEWTHYLTRLIEHPELRRSMGEAGYRSLEAKELWLDQRVDDVHHVLDAVTEAN